MATTKMNPEVKEKWLAALRSGEYRQTEGMLEKDGGFCCLGVLCDLAVKEGITERHEDAHTWQDKDGPLYDTDDIVYGEANSYERSSSSGLPPSVRNWAGLATSTGSLSDPVEGIHWSLVALNDSAQYNFNQIADVIEERF